MSKTKTIDLSTITSIPTGSNIITVKARAAGFADSNSSNSVTYNKTDNEVTISFTNGSGTSYWQFTKIYDNYTITDNTLYLSSEDEIGSITSANGSTTVTTTTNKLFILGKSSELTLLGTTTVSSGIETKGTRSDSEKTGTLSSVTRFYLDGSWLSYTLLWGFSVTANGTITINQADWSD